MKNYKDCSRSGYYVLHIRRGQGFPVFNQRGILDRAGRRSVEIVGRARGLGVEPPIAAEEEPEGGGVGHVDEAGRAVHVEGPVAVRGTHSAVYHAEGSTREKGDEVSFRNL